MKVIVRHISSEDKASEPGAELLKAPLKGRVIKGDAITAMIQIAPTIILEETTSAMLAGNVKEKYPSDEYRLL